MIVCLLLTYFCVFQLKPFKTNLIGVEQDQFGIIPQKLVDALENCKAKYTEEGGGKMPKVIYINPTGKKNILFFKNGFMLTVIYLNKKL